MLDCFLVMVGVEVDGGGRRRNLPPALQDVLRPSIFPSTNKKTSVESILSSSDVQLFRKIFGSGS